jgi:hypothetical protein
VWPPLGIQSRGGERGRGVQPTRGGVLQIELQGTTADSCTLSKWWKTMSAPFYWANYSMVHTVARAWPLWSASRAWSSPELDQLSFYSVPKYSPSTAEMMYALHCKKPSKSQCGQRWCRAKLRGSREVPNPRRSILCPVAQIWFNMFFFTAERTENWAILEGKTTCSRHGMTPYKILFRESRTNAVPAWVHI